MYYIPLNKKNYNIFTETHVSYCKDNQELYEIIFNSIKQSTNTGIELNTLHLYKEILNIGQQRLRSYRLHLANTFRLIEEGNIEIDDEITENELKNLWNVVLEAKEWYGKLNYLKILLRSVQVIPQKERLIKEHTNTLLAKISACSSSMENLSGMLTFNQNNML